MDDDADIHDPVQATTRSATNIGKEKLFKAGKPSVVTDFTVEENQKVFKVQPGTVNAVKLGLFTSIGSSLTASLFKFWKLSYYIIILKFHFKKS